jgi:phosphoribosylformylglycinamidine (FGAM) synthase-like enzyme
MIQGMRLQDGWDSHKRKGYTHFTAHSATRLDRFYTTESLAPRKTEIETIPVAFSDHCAVTIRMTTNTPPPTRGKGFWKMNTILMNEHSTNERTLLSDRLATEWESWKTHIKITQIY